MASNSKTRDSVRRLRRLARRRRDAEVRLAVAKRPAQPKPAK